MSALRRDLLTQRFWRHFLIYTFAGMGAIGGFIRILLVFFPDLSDLAGSAAFSVFTVAAIVWGFYKSWPRPIREEFNAPKMSITIEEGNLLDEKGHIVLGVCNTFDTETPNIIARTSLQGQAQDKLFNNDEAELDAAISKALETKTPTGTLSKKGKTLQYEIGTVLPIKHAARLIYLLAYCDMSEQNKAEATIDGIWKSLLSLWQEVSLTANGGSVAIPAIGGGLARISSILPAQDSIRFIILSFVLASRKQKICDELRVVVHPNDFKRLDRMELQSFLSSLKPS